MALHNGIRHSRRICGLSTSLKSCSAPLFHYQAPNSDKYENNQNDSKNAGRKFANFKDACKIAAAIGLSGFVVYHAKLRTELLAEAQEIDQEIVDKENR